MIYENEEQDLGWAPVQYPGYNDFEPGEWRIVTEDDSPVAVVWTNNDNSSGISWLTQTDLVMEIRKLFLTGASAGMPASQAYMAVESLYSENLSREFTGTLTGVNETLQAMMAEIDESI